MTNKEASARIKINKLLEKSGWRFFASEEGKANIELEGKVSYSKEVEDALGNDFEGRSAGYMDYTLLDERGFPICVVEAKKSSINPLSAKDQARKYALENHARFIILTNGDSHYFWDTEKGHPERITVFPNLESLQHRETYNPNKDDLVSMVISEDFLKPQKTLRGYQVEAIHKIQEATKLGKDKYLLEMATGTGKTTVAAAVCKLFLKSGNAKRILFLVDRIELEKQAEKSFNQIFENVYTIKTIKSKEWNKAEIVVSTIQTLMTNNRYRDIFSPSDFELVVSDEAHRGLSGNSRAVFEYFIGYKLGLTATPKDYLKGVDEKDLQSSNPKALELRNLRDTYKTFGCEDQTPTFRYDLTKGVKAGHLLAPYAVDARTEKTTELLSKAGILIKTETDDGDSEEVNYKLRDFERTFFNEKTNRVFCRALLENGLRDPFTQEFGKTLVFCVSQAHAAKVSNILCHLADEYFPGKYSDSDFAVQVTSSVANSQDCTEKFSANQLNGNSRFGQETYPDYKTSKSRICVTVGMMTTGYDCPDLLNVVLMRPVYSPSDFIQMKGRGTRTHGFKYAETGEIKLKEKFLLLDFFANCEYFEKEFNYSEKLKLTVNSSSYTTSTADRANDTINESNKHYDDHQEDRIDKIIEIVIGAEGMRIDRELYPELRQQFEQVVNIHPALQEARDNEDFDAIEDILKEQIFEKPNEYWNPTKIRDSYTKLDKNINRKLSLKEMILKALGLIDTYKTREERITEEYEKFIDIYKLNVEPPQRQRSLQNFFESYLSDEHFRKTIDNRTYADLNTSPIMSFPQFQDISEYSEVTSRYINEYLVSEIQEFDWQY